MHTRLSFVTQVVHACIPCVYFVVVCEHWWLYITMMTINTIMIRQPEYYMYIILMVLHAAFCNLIHRVSSPGCRSELAQH